MSYFVLMGRRIPKQAITGFKFQNETDNICPFLSIRIRGKEEIIPFKDKKEIQSVKAHLCSVFSGFVKIGDWYLKMKEMKTVFDLSRDEIVALTDEEISLYIDKELAGKGIPIEAKNWNIKNEKEVVYPDCGVPIFVIKDIGVGFRKIEDATEVVNLLVRSRAFKVGSKYLNRSYERLNVINEGVVPAVEGCVGYTNEEFERVNKENNDPESAKIGSFNKTVEETNNIRSRVLKYVDKIKQERAYNIDLCMTFERYIEIADKDAERAMAFLKEAYPFNEETEVFIRKRYNMSIDVNPEEN